MVGTVPATIPEDKSLSSEPKIRNLFKLIKVHTVDDDDSLDASYTNKSHTQLFYNVTNKKNLSGCTPSYCREVYRPSDKIDNLYWFKEALRTVTSSEEPTLTWSINQVSVKKSLGRIVRPRSFSINNKMLGSHSEFEYGSVNGEPKGYSGEVSTPFDNTSFQRYRWVRYKDGSRWAFIARNDPSNNLVEFRKTNFENEFEIAFLKSPPLGWKLDKLDSNNLSKLNENTTSTSFSDQFMGRYPSMFSTSTYRTSTTSGFLSNRESSFSETSYSNLGRISTFTNSSNNKNSRFFSINNLPDLSEASLERYWIEFVLATTVVIQDEVNSSRRRLWNKKNE